MSPNLLAIIVYVVGLVGVVVYTVAVYRATKSSGAAILSTAVAVLLATVASAGISFGLMALLAALGMVDPNTYDLFKTGGAVVQSAAQLGMLYVAYRGKLLWPAGVASHEGQTSSKLAAHTRRMRIYAYLALGIVVILIVLSGIGSDLIGVMRLMTYLLIGIVLLLGAQFVVYLRLSQTENAQRSSTSLPKE